jgi:hypothetical protein
MSDCYLVATPFNEQKVLKLFEGTVEPAEIKIFQEKVGSLIWIIIGIRPDITIAVAIISCYSHNPRPEHIIAIN